MQVANSNQAQTVTGVDYLVSDKRITVSVDKNTKFEFSTQDQSWRHFEHDSVTNKWIKVQSSWGDPHNSVGDTDFDTRRSYSHEGRNFQINARTDFSELDRKRATYNQDVAVRVIDDDTGQAVQFTVTGLNSNDLNVYANTFKVGSSEIKDKIYVADDFSAALIDTDSRPEAVSLRVIQFGHFNADGNFIGSVNFDGRPYLTEQMANNLDEMLGARVASGEVQVAGQVNGSAVLRSITPSTASRSDDEDEEKEFQQQAPQFASLATPTATSPAAQVKDGNTLKMDLLADMMEAGNATRWNGPSEQRALDLIKSLDTSKLDGSEAAAISRALKAAASDGDINPADANVLAAMVEQANSSAVGT